MRHPVVGFEVQPGIDWSLIVEMEVRAAGMWRYDGLVVDYLYDGRVYSPRMDVSFVICADQPESCLDPSLATS